MDHRASLQLGVNVTGWHAGAFSESAMERSLGQAAGHGFNCVTFIPTWYVKTPDDVRLAPRPLVTVNDAALVGAMEIAERLGLTTTLKPHIDVADYSVWRGTLDPPDRDGWWERYEWMLLHYAELAEHTGAATLTIGTELGRLTGPNDDSHWRRLIAAVRDRFSGALTYASHDHGELDEVTFWDALDYLGVDLYPQLVEEHAPLPQDGELVQAWRPHVERLGELHERWGLPIVITEIGYRSITAAPYRPSDWRRQGSLDASWQAAAYEAAYAALSEAPWLAGIHWWDWPAELEEAAADQTGYSPHGKPAAAVARRWNFRLRGREASEHEDLPFVSVVVPVRNGEATIGDCVSALMSMDYPRQLREIIVVDNASTDGTAALLHTLPVRYFQEPRIGRSYARNRGIQESIGEYVAFTDADCLASPGWLRQLVGKFRSDGVSGVAGEILSDPPRTAAQRFVARRYPNWQSVVLELSEPFAITANVAYRRDVFERIGLFDPEFVTAEDVDFGWRFFAAGLKMSYSPEATVSHRLRPTSWQLLRQQAGLGYGRVLLRERYDLAPGYALPSWDEIKQGASRLVQAAIGRQAPEDLGYTLYDLLVMMSLRAGAARRGLARSLPGFAAV